MILTNDKKSWFIYLTIAFFLTIVPAKATTIFYSCNMEGHKTKNNIAGNAFPETKNNSTTPMTTRDVYLVIGQSNTAGRAPIETIDQVTLTGVDLFNGTTWEAASNPMNIYSTIRKDVSLQGLSYAYTFGRTLYEATGRQIGLVVNARGGTSIDQWLQGAADAYFDEAVNRMNAALAIPGSTLKGIVWHQGESSSTDPAYLTKIQDLISDLRSEFGIPDLPFIAGQLAHDYASSEPFNTNIQQLPTLVANTDFVVSSDLEIFDSAHFDSNAQRILGNRYASKILQWVYGYQLSTAKIYVDQETYVRGGAHVGTNYGSETVARVKEITGFPDFNRRTYAQFDLSSIDGQIIDAYIHLNALVQEVSNIDIDVYGVSNSWDENTMTFSNAPSLTNKIESTNISDTSYSDQDIFVSEYVQQVSGTTVSFGLQSFSNGQMVITTKEDVANFDVRPFLLINYFKPHTTFTDGSWDNGNPVVSKGAVVAENYATLSGDINASTLSVLSGATLTVGAGEYVEVQGDIDVRGGLIVENEGSIIQVDDSAITMNTGTIQVQKTTPSLNPRDFILLSSPMSSETANDVFSTADRAFAIDGTLFTPDPSVTTTLNFLDTNGDYFSPATSLQLGEGYLVFPQAVNDVGAIQYAHTYSQGTLNSGTINRSLVYNGPLTANNFSLGGNPYASAIDVNTLISQNASISAIYYWEHITEPEENLPGFNTENFSMDDVSIRNMLGGIASVNGGTAPGQFMASGQGFAVLADQAQSGSNTPLVFTNAMRVTGNNGTPRSAVIEVDKLWLSIKSSDFTVIGTTLIGFTPETTSALDSGYDSQRLATTFSLFSTLDDGTQLSIQSREAFDENMEIEMGFETTLLEPLSYTIGIDQWEGVNLDETQIFLIDNELKIVTNLKEDEYTFTASESVQSNRFKVVFNERILSTEDALSQDNQIRIFPNPATGQITMSSQEPLNLNTAKIYNIQGQEVLTMDMADFSTSKQLDISQLASGLYMVRFEGLDINQVYRLLVR